MKRGPHVFMTRIDEAAFSRALLEAFPGVKFWEEGWNGCEWVERRVEAIHLAGHMIIYVLVPRPAWGFEEPVWSGALSKFWDAGPVSCVILHRSVWDWTTTRGAKWAWDPPILTGGHMAASYLKDNPFDEHVVTSVLRRVLPSAARRFSSTEYVGHDALRWASEAPRRMIDGYLRPPDGWSFDKLRPSKRKYYEGLKAMRPESDPQPPPGMDE